MATLTAILDASRFTEGAGSMVNALASVYSSLDDAYRKMQKFEITMSTFSGSLPEARSDLDTLYAITQKLGISFEAAAAPFAKFAGAAQDFSEAEIYNVFTGVSTALSAVRANTSEVNGVFLALQQIVSKGKLSMEELRLQLAERIPGAMKLAASSVGMSMGDFEEAVRKGTINTKDFLISFSNSLRNEFSGAAELAAESWDASLQRMQNSWLTMKAGLVFDTGVSEQWTTIVDQIKAVIDDGRVQSSWRNMLLDLTNMATGWTTSVGPLMPATMQVIEYAMSGLSVVVNTLGYSFDGLVMASSEAAAGLWTVYRATLATTNIAGVWDDQIASATANINSLHSTINTYAGAAEQKIKNISTALNLNGEKTAMAEAAAKRLEARQKTLDSALENAAEEAKKFANNSSAISINASKAASGTATLGSKASKSQQQIQQLARESEIANGFIDQFGNTTAYVGQYISETDQYVIGIEDDIITLGNTMDDKFVPAASNTVTKLINIKNAAKEAREEIQKLNQVEYGDTDSSKTSKSKSSSTVINNFSQSMNNQQVADLTTKQTRAMARS